MNECKKDNGLNSIYGAMYILYFAEKENANVYLHCHAGIHRSNVVKSCYFMMRTGSQLEMNYGGFINPLLADCARGYLPPKNETEDFLKYLNTQLEKYEFRMMGGILDDCKLNTLRNF